MKTLFPLLFLAAFAGAQGGGVSASERLAQAERNLFNAERDVEDARYFLGIANDHLRRDWSALMPLVEPPPPLSFTFTNGAAAPTWVVVCDKDSKNCKLGPGYTLDDVIAIYKRDCVKF